MLEGTVNSHCLTFSNYPHEQIEVHEIAWNEYKDAWIARWTTDFDCPNKTQYWYCIKDTPFDIKSLKAKRRYEIKKGKKNFYTKIISPCEYKKELYEVYEASLEGYKNNPQPVSYNEFINTIETWQSIDECFLFGCFFYEDDSLCAYADVYNRKPYLPISSLKSKPAMEKYGVNFSLVCGIVEFFENELKCGSYLCDGGRVVYHETNFQEFLYKYFGFRKAYCNLHIEYRKPIRIIVRILFPFRFVLGKINKLAKTVFTLEAWKRGMER
ncbi:hypothetical protein [Pseudobutyrivibrio xylanivorans]|uniref:Uncharacterized protein n=1 Tax=Pseudobutyrivibrio xylanivorans TaxID=185007 RepID=A0A1G5S4I8_PSEXY|nr:hypothetical protein [Pseudobutyrivibrio xylanivorans]SCZ81236.1 hypothetical protein SAMN02910350_02705 [Pseudobutyrivibrio xylanivorans]